MGDKEIKGLLKEAREQIKNKEFKSALKECKKIINKDKNNYMALVFCGLSLSELDQPDQALQVICLPSKTSFETGNIFRLTTGLQIVLQIKP